MNRGCRCRKVPSRYRQVVERFEGDQVAVSRSVAEAVAFILGGVAGIGLEVHSDAELADAVAAGFDVKAIDALKQRGVTGAEVNSLIIKPRTLSHRRANGGRLTVDESDRAARVARGLVLAERTFANREKASRWMHRNLGTLGGRTPMELLRTDAGARAVESLLARISWGAAA